MRQPWITAPRRPRRQVDHVGAVREEPDRLVLTDQGRYLWVMAMREFFIGVDTMRDVCRAQAGITD